MTHGRGHLSVFLRIGCGFGGSGLSSNFGSVDLYRHANKRPNRCRHVVANGLRT
jgi:hypothetical protein